jgi:hypothetical protein
MAPVNAHSTNFRAVIRFSNLRVLIVINRLYFSSVLFSETPNFGCAKAPSAPPLTTALSVAVPSVSTYMSMTSGNFCK